MKVVMLEDTTKDGASTRREAIFSLCLAGNFQPELWTSHSQLEIEGEVLLIAHKSELPSGFISTLERFLRPGITVVYYTGGSDTDSHQDGRNGSMVARMRYQVLLQAIGSLQRGSGLGEFRLAFESVIRRNTLYAIAILCWSLTVETELADVNKRRAKWLSSNEEWKRVFGMYSEAEFRILCGVGTSEEWPSRWRGLKSLVDWIHLPKDAVGSIELGAHQNASTTPDTNAPNCSVILAELKKNLSLRFT